jgi:hypothetical protein
MVVPPLLWEKGVLRHFSVPEIMESTESIYIMIFPTYTWLA